MVRLRIFAASLSLHSANPLLQTRVTLGNVRLQLPMMRAGVLAVTEVPGGGHCPGVRGQVDRAAQRATEQSVSVSHEQDS